MIIAPMIIAKIRSMKLRYLFVLLWLSHTGWAQAEIYKHVDAEGHVTYSSTPAKGSKKIDLGPLNASPPPERSRNIVSPSDFPKVDSATQKSRDNTRRKILEDELATEENLLADARQKLKDAEGNSETPAKKIKTLQEQVLFHEKNMDALKSEITNNR